MANCLTVNNALSVPDIIFCNVHYDWLHATSLVYWSATAEAWQPKLQF